MKLVLSAINIVDGGALTVLRDCVRALSVSSESFSVLLLLSDKAVLKGIDLDDRFSIKTYPDSKKSWFKRLYYEYFYFKSNYKGYDVWFSLHDITPRVDARIQLVYCHNPSIFLKPSFFDFKFDKKQFLFSLFYVFLYKINIKSNDFVVFQQFSFSKFFEGFVSRDRMLISPPDLQDISNNYDGAIEVSESIPESFYFYPAFPRTFKNQKLIIEAAVNAKSDNFVITVSGDENPYSKYLLEYKERLGADNVYFIGRCSRDDTLSLLYKSKGLVFPSLAETWGLPITEAKSLGKSIILADLDYAKETLGKYTKVNFFDPGSTSSLIEAIERNNNHLYNGSSFSVSGQNYYPGWEALWKRILNL